jgi:hypothetical protein
MYKEVSEGELMDLDLILSLLTNYQRRMTTRFGYNDILFALINCGQMDLVIRFMKYD